MRGRDCGAARRRFLAKTTILGLSWATASTGVIADAGTAAATAAVLVVLEVLDHQPESARLRVRSLTQARLPLLDNLGAGASLAQLDPAGGEQAPLVGCAAMLVRHPVTWRHHCR